MSKSRHTASLKAPTKKGFFDWGAERRKREEKIRTEVKLGLRPESALQEFEEPEVSDLPPPVAKKSTTARKSRAKYATEEERTKARQTKKITVSREEVKRLHSEGKTSREIATEMNCAATTVRVVLKELGLQAHKDQPIRKGKHSRNEVIAAVEKYGTYEAAGKALGLTAGTIYYHIHKSREARLAKEKHEAEEKLDS